MTTESRFGAFRCAPDDAIRTGSSQGQSGDEGFSCEISGDSQRSHQTLPAHFGPRRTQNLWRWWPLRYLEHFGLRPVCQLFPAIRSHDVPLMPNAKEVFHRRQQPLAKAARSTISQRSQELHVTNQMRPTKLYAGSKAQAELAVGAVVVATDHAGKGLAKELLEDIRTPRVIDMKPRETIRTRHVKSPGPKLLGILGMSRLVDVHRGAGGQCGLQIFITG